MPIETTVVGSFPKSKSPFEEAIREVVDLQLHYSLDLITDGEMRGNMIQYYEQIPGLEKHGDGLRIAGKIEPIQEDRIDEFYRIKDYRVVRSTLASMGREDVKVKIGITGPMTLGTICASTDIDGTLEHYDLREGEEDLLYSDFANALLPVVQRALDLGAYVQIDEPLLSTQQVSIESARKILKDFTAKLPSSPLKEERVLCHVCGSIKSVDGLYDLLLSLNIPILSLGFSGEKETENFDVISQASFEKHGKKLGAGFISNVNVEDEKTVLARYKRIEAIMGKENIRYVHPDCGFRLTPIKKVKSILQTMKAVANRIT